ncbi:MAG: hypothetical protein MZV70_77075 [Desulfobacterales bacterium]|nr:hypothetical protein [Desulfobacterales bacterium]
MTGEMSLLARAGAKWVRPVSYRVVEVRKEQGGHVLTTVSVPVEAMEGKGNYVWFRVNDSAGNSGLTGYVTGEGGWTDELREEANRVESVECVGGPTASDLYGCAARDGATG